MGDKLHHFMKKKSKTFASNSGIITIPAKFHDLSVMLTNLKDSHDLTIVF